LLGKDEFGDLARDFDVMAAAIQLLITAQRRFVANVSHELGAPLARMPLALAPSPGSSQKKTARNRRGGSMKPASSAAWCSSFCSAQG
jgi:hypothetical protein